MHFDKKDHLFNWSINLTLILLSSIILIPLIFIISNSLSGINDVYYGKVFLIPKNITFKAYQMVLMNSKILTGFKNTILYTLIGTLISLSMTLTAGYALSRDDLPFKRYINIFFILTMFISGGMIPTYLVVEKLGLIDNFFGFILPGALSVWNVLVVRTFFKISIPSDIEDAAQIDGCSDFKLFLKIVLPMSKPIIAIMILYYAVGYWNSYFNSLLYLNSSNLFPLQRVLSDLLITSDPSNWGVGGGLEEQGRMLKSLQYTTIIISSLPMIALYPFVQKHFVKGALMGSIKG
ncbi:MAG: carbohydrate ABC transporter permease [Acholeplasmataceae bacterium]